MRNVRNVFAASALLLSLVVAVPAATAAETVVTFWHYGAAAIVQIAEEIAKDFEAENPGIKIEIFNPGTPDGWDKWAVAIAAGIPPDASLGNGGILDTLGDALEPLEGYAEKSSNIKRDNFFVSHWDANWIGGHMLALPFRANSHLIMYHKQIFAEAGLDPGVTPATWAELAGYAGRLTVKSGNDVRRYGFSFRNVDPDRTVRHFSERNAWQPFNPEFTEAYYTDEKFVETLEFLNGMIANGVATMKGMPLAGQFFQGNVAMMDDGPWVLNSAGARNADWNEIGTFLPPVGPSGEQPYANMAGENLVMFKDSKNKEAAWKWISYLAYDRNGEYNRRTGTFFPVVRYAAQDPYWFESPLWSSVLQNYVEGRTPVRHRPCNVEFASDGLFIPVLNDIFFQRKAVQQALAELQEVALNDLRNPRLLACEED